MNSCQQELQQRSFRELLIDSDISPVSETAFVLSCTKLSKSTLSWSTHFTQELCSSVRREQNLHQEENTHMVQKSHSLHLFLLLCSFMFFQQMGLLRHSVDVSSWLSSCSHWTLWMPPLWKKKFGREPFSLGDSLILLSLCESGLMLCQFLFCAEPHLK